MKPEAMNARLKALNSGDPATIAFVRRLIEREEGGEAAVGAQGVMALVSQRRKQSPDYPDAKMEQVCAAKPDHIPDPGKMVERLAHPPAPLTGPVKAGPEDFKLWMEQENR